MAVREFDGTDDDIVTGVGALSGMTYGTIAALVKPDMTSNARIYFGMSSSSSDEMSVFFGFDSPSSQYLGWFNADAGFLDEESNFDGFTNQWWLVVFRKPSGNAVARMSAYNLATDTWTHDDLDFEGTTIGEWGAPGSGGAIALSSLDLNDQFYDGLIAVRAAWANTLPWAANSTGDSQIEAAGLETAASNWLSASPDAMWRFNQAATSTAVTDDTGNGADQSSLTGTTVITGDDPPGFDFSITAAVQGTANVPLGGINLAATGKRVVHGTAAMPLGGLTLTAVGEVAGVVLGSAQVQLGGLNLAATVAAAGEPASYEFHIDWDNDGDFGDTGEDVTGDVLRREPLSIVYGRDQARSLSPMRSGEASFLLNNVSRDYSPENESSPLAGNVLPARPTRIRATHLEQTYNLFHGFTDDYDVLPDINNRSVKLTFLDALARFRGTEISTELHHSIRTGEAIGLILDAIGWPAADRDLDLGATVLPWWWEDGTDALDALEGIVSSEGPPSLATVGSDGEFVFRDRHHRLTDAASLTSQVTFTDVDVEPVFARPLIYDHGWRDIINSVTFQVGERAPAGVPEVVWSGDEIYSIADGESLPVRTRPSDPVLNAIVPVEGTDFRLRSGAVTASLLHTSGQSVTILLTASGGPAVLDELQLRAFPVAVRRTLRVHVEDPASVEQYGRRTGSIEAPFANVHDALAIAEIILAHRAERLPMVQMRVQSATNDRLTQQLNRDLSDRITIVEPELGLNDEFFIEQIKHDVPGFFYHETVFGCEKVPAQVDDVFRFDVAGRGFDDGKFGKTGLDDPDTMFRFDVAGRGFDDGLFAT